MKMTPADNPGNEKFHDPLEDYSAPVFDDPIEEALHEKLVASLQTQPHMCVSAETSVRDTMKLMVGQQIACVLVEEDGRLVGVFGDRDVLDKVALEYDAVIDGPVRNVMSANPVSVREDESAAKVLSIMAVSGYRHIPVVNPDGRTIGIVSPQRMAHFLFSYLES